MTRRPIHLLHLSGGSLSWATLRPAAGRLASLLEWKLAETGRAEGAPEELLDRWADERAADRGDVVLYDARPLYFSFASRIPLAAIKQRENIVKLKIRQELGLSDQEIYWSSRADPAPGSPGQLDLFTIVARREALADILEWQERRKLASLWIGPDIGAIRALVSRGVVPPSVVVIDSDDHGATLYHSNGGGRIARDRADLNGRRHEPPAMEWAPETTRAHFGALDSARLLREYPALESLRAAIPSAPARRRSGPITLPSPGSAGLDAVLAGALADLELGLRPPSLRPRPAMESLVRGLKSDAPLLQRAGSIPLRRAAGAAAIAVASLILTLWGTAKLREGARLELVKQANSLTSRLKAYQSQEAALRKIKADRAPILPILEAVHHAAPEGVTLNSLSVSSTGVVQLDGRSDSPSGPNDFFKAIAESKLFEKPQLQDVKTNGKLTTFQMTATVKGRGKGKR